MRFLGLDMGLERPDLQRSARGIQAGRASGYQQSLRFAGGNYRSRRSKAVSSRRSTTRDVRCRSRTRESTHRAHGTPEHVQLRAHLDLPLSGEPEADRRAAASCGNLWPRVSSPLCANPPGEGTHRIWAGSRQLPGPSRCSNVECGDQPGSYFHGNLPVAARPAIRECGRSEASTRRSVPGPVEQSSKTGRGGISRLAGTPLRRRGRIRIGRKRLLPMLALRAAALEAQALSSPREAIVARGPEDRQRQLLA